MFREQNAYVHYAYILWISIFAYKTWLTIFRMSPNATDSSAILREERKIPNGCANGWSGVPDSAEKHCWKGKAAFKINEIVGLVKYYALRSYIVLWRKSGSFHIHPYGVQSNL